MNIELFHHAEENEETKEQTQKHQNYNRGFQDGSASRSFKNPIHLNWKIKPGSKNTRIHHNADYKRGYEVGYGEKV